MSVIQQQFEDEPLISVPNPNKEYWVSPITKTKGITILMKYVLLANKHPHLLEKLINTCDLTTINATLENGGRL